mmetsp:Transcript_37314/g.93672  ORF Transcript_37314/g.93672 Transcript_37314/m.93672 type:complete len:103 (+) Transcript_37314:307-615(+)
MRVFGTLLQTRRVFWGALMQTGRVFWGTLLQTMRVFRDSAADQRRKKQGANVDWSHLLGADKRSSKGLRGPLRRQALGRTRVAAGLRGLGCRLGEEKTGRRG